MKRIVIAASFLLIGSTAFSQVGIGIGGGGFGMGMNIPLNKKKQEERNMRNLDQRVKMMKSDLNLSDEQEVKLRGLLIERDRRMRGPNPMTRKEYNDRLRQFLSEEQYMRLLEIRKERQRQDKIQPVKKEQDPQQQEGDVDDVYN